MQQLYAPKNQLYREDNPYLNHREKNINRPRITNKMDVDIELLRRVAAVARLNLTDDELHQFQTEFKDVLDAFSKIDAIDTEGIPPSFQPVEISNSLREDIIKPSLTQEEALRNSEHKSDGYFKGPKVA